LLPSFSDLDEYLRLPAMTSLALAPDGSWLAAAVQELGPEPKKHVTSIWRIDAAGGPPVRLTRSAEGEAGPEFLPDGSVLFISKRPDTTAKPASDGQGDKPALWLLPAGGGEARQVTAPPGGAGGVVAARNAQSYLMAAAAFPGTDSPEADAARRKARADAGVNAILHEGDLLRYWDHDLGPGCLRLFAGQAAAAIPGAPAPGAAGAFAGEPAGPRDLTPDPGRALDEQSFDLSPDGSLAATGWEVPEETGGTRTQVVLIDVATAARRVFLSAGGFDFVQPVFSPDGGRLAAIRGSHDSYDGPGDWTIVLADTGGDGEAGQVRDLLPGLDRHPQQIVWAPDGESLYFTADDNGRRPVFAVRIASGELARVTTDDAAYDQLCPAPDGRSLYALRASISEPPSPVRIDLQGGSAAAPERLASPAGTIEVPGRVEEVATTVQDGSTVRAWLALPEGASAAAPAPLLLWVHGGPVMSWNSWSWRWNPWLMVARGYAVLLPDPALSTGYGQSFIARGHGTWGDKPFTDVMAITDAVVQRPDIDASRTAMMGGSFGGYMANWIAGHTSRFSAIVSHAGLWALDQMMGTTDNPHFWHRMLGRPDTEPERYQANSPHLHAGKIVTPLLIIHGDQDYRVPISEALRMYSDLVSRSYPVKFLYFPDENHWILKPGDVKVWYETVFAFLAEHVLGQEWKRPELL
jgi:dipeptidyl aminopeptidase/acylaminoacyl peptidase